MIFFLRFLHKRVPAAVRSKTAIKTIHNVPADEDVSPEGMSEGACWGAVVPASVLGSAPVFVPGSVWMPGDALLLFWERAGVLGLFGVIGRLALFGTFPWDTLLFGVFGPFGALG